MPNTTNFNWPTPADTDLVKDGAAAIRNLGNGIDTSLIDLKGGTTGQILSKASNADMDFTFITPNVGDITEVQAGVGISIASGTGPIPVITNSSTDLITTAGDILYGTAADTVSRLGIGTAGQLLAVNSGATAPEWVAAPTASAFTKITNQAVSSSTTISVNDVFSSTYDNYLIVATLYGGGGQVGDIRLRVGGTDNTTANSYQYNRIDSNGATLVSATTTSDKWSGIILSADDIAYQRFFMYRPFPTTFTGIECSSSINGAEVHLSGGRHNQNVSYTGFTILFGSSVSGQIVVYGLGE